MVYNKNKLHCVINIKAIVIHVLAYALFLASFMYLYYSTLRPNAEGIKISSRKFGINVNIKTLFLAMSVMCMSYAFWEIHRMSGGS